MNDSTLWQLIASGDIKAIAVQLAQLAAESSNAEKREVEGVRE